MRLVIQRVTSGKVKAEGETVGEIQKGYVVLCGVKKGDTKDMAEGLAEKLLNLRIMADDEMKNEQIYSGCKRRYSRHFTVYALF